MTNDGVFAFLQQEAESNPFVSFGISIAGFLLVFQLIQQCCHRPRKKVLIGPGDIDVQCWFCQSFHSVPYLQKNSWECPSCDQYNGFNASGDYNKPVPDMYAHEDDNGETKESAPAHQTSAGKGAPSVLCEACTNNAEKFMKAMQEYDSDGDLDFSDSDDSGPSRAREYIRELEAMYAPCEDCERRVKKGLRKVNTTINISYSKARKEMVVQVGSSSWEFSAVKGLISILFALPVALCDLVLAVSLGYRAPLPIAPMASGIVACVETLWAAWAVATGSVEGAMMACMARALAHFAVGTRLASGRCSSKARWSSVATLLLIGLADVYALCSHYRGGHRQLYLYILVLAGPELLGGIVLAAFPPESHLSPQVAAPKPEQDFDFKRTPSPLRKRKSRDENGMSGSAKDVCPRKAAESPLGKNDGANALEGLDFGLGSKVPMSSRGPSPVLAFEPQLQRHRQEQMRRSNNRTRPIQATGSPATFHSPRPGQISPRMTPESDRRSPFGSVSPYAVRVGTSVPPRGHVEPRNRSTSLSAIEDLIVNININDPRSRVAYSIFGIVRFVRLNHLQCLTGLSLILYPFSSGWVSGLIYFFVVCLALFDSALVMCDIYLAQRDVHSALRIFKGPVPSASSVGALALCLLLLTRRAYHHLLTAAAELHGHRETGQLPTMRENVLVLWETLAETVEHWWGTMQDWQHLDLFLLVAAISLAAIMNTGRPAKM